MNNIKTKFIRNIGGNGGFTLTECLVALALFAFMMMFLSQMMMMCVEQKRKNSETAEDLDMRVSDIVDADIGGDFSLLGGAEDYDGAEGSFGGDTGLVFKNADGTEEYIIKGDVKGYYSEDGILRVTKSDFEFQDLNEYDLIVAQLFDEPPSFKLCSAAPYMQIKIMETISGSFVTWKVSMTEYGLDGVFCLLLPDGADTGIESANGCAAYVIKSAADPGKSAVRVRSLEFVDPDDYTLNSAEFEVRFFAPPGWDNTSFCEHFGYTGNTYNALTFETADQKKYTVKGGEYA